MDRNKVDIDRTWGKGNCAHGEIGRDPHHSGQWCCVNCGTPLKEIKRYRSSAAGVSDDGGCVGGRGQPGRGRRWMGAAWHLVPL